jgi:hypothetical protein
VQGRSALISLLHAMHLTVLNAPEQWQGCQPALLQWLQQLQQLLGCHWTLAPAQHKGSKHAASMPGLGDSLGHTCNPPRAVPPCNMPPLV